MRRATKNHLGLVMGEAISRVLHDPDEVAVLSTFAFEAGYSQFHFSRMFRDITGEPPMAFVRRIRLERATYHILEGARMDAVNLGRPGALSRSIKHAYGVSARDLKRSGSDWRLPSPGGLHWIPNCSCTADWLRLKSQYPTKIGRQGPIRLAVIQSSSVSAQNPLARHPRFRAAASRDQNKWVTLYDDDLRAQIGFTLAGPKAPEGYLEVSIPAGLVVKTERYLPHGHLAEARQFLSDHWSRPTLTWDEHTACPHEQELCESRLCMLFTAETGGVNQPSHSGVV